MIVSEVKSKLGSSISWVTSHMGTMLPISTSVILWIFLRNQSRGLCRGWHSVKKCCLVSGLVPHTLQVGFTANWLNTALLLWRVYVPVRRQHLSCARRLSWILTCTDVHTWCAAPTLTLSGFIYLKEDFVKISSRHWVSTTLLIALLTICFLLGHFLGVETV